MSGRRSKLDPFMVALTFAVLCVCGCGRLATIDRYDAALELGVAAAMAGDALQTAEATGRCTESNAIVGHCGQRVPVVLYFATAAVLHAAVALALPPGRWRAAFQAVVLGAEVHAVYRNRVKELEIRKAGL